MLVAIGTVVQDVVADAMSTEVVPRIDAAGNERPDNDGARRAWHGAGAGPARGVGRRARRRRPLGMARQFHAAPGRFPDRPDHPGDFGRRRVPARHRDHGTAADRLAHSRRRHRVRRHRGGARRRRHAVRPGDHLRHLDGGGLLHARAGDGRARSQHQDGHPVRHHHRVRVPRRARRSATASSGGRWTSSISTPRSTARCGRPARSCRSP